MTTLPASLRRFPAPGESPPSLETMQVHYNGLTIGANTRYAILGVEGLDMGGQARSGDVDLPRDHGQTPGLDVYGGRDILFDLWLAAGDGLSLSTLQTNLAYATQVQPNEELPLWVQLPGLPPLASMCRPRNRKGKIDTKYTAGAVWEPELPLHATDPRMYGAGESLSASAEKPREGGLSFPVTFPATFGSTLPAILEVNNAGTVEMRPIAVLTGPLDLPSLTNASIGGEPYIQIARPLGEEPTVRAGDELVVSFANPRLMLYYQGGVESGSEGEDVRNWLVAGSSWWNLPPRATSRIEFRVAAATSGSAELQWAPAWML